jgi:hypothetical protein
MRIKKAVTKAVTECVLPFWRKAGIATLCLKSIKDKVFSLHKEYFDHMKDAGRDGEIYRNQNQKFTEKLSRWIPGLGGLSIQIRRLMINYVIL